MPLRLWGLLIFLIFPLHSYGQDFSANERFRFDGSGVLIISSARDTTGFFNWGPGPGTGRISLHWEGGFLSVPDTLAMEAYPNNNLAVPLKAGFSGTVKNKPMLLEDGIYPITGNVVLGDGTVQLVISTGELEIHGPRVRYRHQESDLNKTRANFLLIAGLLILIVVLLRRSRRILRKGS
ncbi:MAG: hypothetical protein GY780_16545 [bacterium]|nr:hypothetical protein [bacterium]